MASIQTAVLDGGPLTLEAVESIARHCVTVAIAPDTAAALRTTRAFVDRLAASTEPIYGITTGVGKLRTSSFRPRIGVRSSGISC